MNMLDTVINHFGGGSELARVLGVTHAAVSQWRSDGSIPPLRAIQIEALTNGQFRAVDLVHHAEQDEVRE